MDAPSGHGLRRVVRQVVSELLVTRRVRFDNVRLGHDDVWPRVVALRSDGKEGGNESDRTHGVLTPPRRGWPPAAVKSYFHGRQSLDDDDADGDARAAAACEPGAAAGAGRSDPEPGDQPPIQDRPHD